MLTNKEKKKIKLVILGMCDLSPINLSFRYGVLIAIRMFMYDREDHYLLTVIFKDVYCPKDYDPTEMLPITTKKFDEIVKRLRDYNLHVDVTRRNWFNHERCIAHSTTKSCMQSDVGGVSYE